MMLQPQSSAEIPEMTKQNRLFRISCQHFLKEKGRDRRVHLHTLPRLVYDSGCWPPGTLLEEEVSVS